MPGLFDKMRGRRGEKVLEASIRFQGGLGGAAALRGRSANCRAAGRNTLAELGPQLYEMYNNSAFDQEVLAQQCGTLSLPSTPRSRRKRSSWRKYTRRPEMQLGRAEAGRPA